MTFNNKYKILLVEDDANIRSVVGAILETDGYSVITAESCALAISIFLSHLPDAVILDLGLPDKDGGYFIKYIRQNYLTPIIVLSARTDETDKVSTLDCGANDYITKPFGAAELLARVRGAIRIARQRENGKAYEQGIFKLKDLEINYDARQIFVGDKEIKVTQTEYNILALLSENCGKMMTYASIVKGVWGYCDDGSVKKLQVNMANIRKKFGVRPGEEWYITNELGVGYRMNGER